MKVIRFLLFPFTILYHFVTKLRNLFFDNGILKQTLFKIPVIVVGNLSVGGTGKTPQIEYLIRLLQNNYKTAVLSRGYGRKTKGYIHLNDQHTANDVGDEPLQYFKKFTNIDVAVDENRVEGIQYLLANNNPEVVLLDDAYQHRKVEGSFYVLLTKYNDLFVEDYLLPTGNLRESSSGAKRADVILITKCPESLLENEQSSIKQKLSKFNKPVFFTSISYAKNIKGFYQFDIENLKEYSVLLITGIANPNPLIQYLKEHQIQIQHLKYKDHHNFTDIEIVDILNRFKEETATKKLILTTEKDYVRLSPYIKELSYLPIETKFLQNQHTDFDRLIYKHLKEFSI
ncbi:tetraacyldisaccharide 4'-kinase [Polaribacter sp.]|uniref:tetraacyldisaccharide 4'-kinase n=1 Tax=Polaribacter sp. TaxID=1920175 RepID=UPI003F6CCA8D